MGRYVDGAGYILVDNSCSGGKREEDDLLGCAHCPKFIKKSEWIRDGGMKAHCCDKAICLECAKVAPQVECPGSQVDQIERALDDLHRREQNARILGI